MAFEQNELSFSLFKNKYKEKPNHPDRTGTVKVGGKLYRMAGWIKQTKGGDDYLSGALTLEEEEGKPKEARPVGQTGFQDLDDDIPFVLSLLEYSIDPPKARRLKRGDYR